MHTGYQILSLPRLRTMCLCAALYLYMHSVHVGARSRQDMLQHGAKRVNKCYLDASIMCVNIYEPGTAMLSLIICLWALVLLQTTIYCMYALHWAFQNKIKSNKNLTLISLSHQQGYFPLAQLRAQRAGELEMWGLNLWGKNNGLREIYYWGALWEM